MLSYRRKIGGAALIISVSLAPRVAITDPARGQTPAEASGLIVFAREGSESGIYTIEQSGSALTRLTDGQDIVHGGPRTEPAWCSRGSRGLAFVATST